ncbi:hypothetical protein KC963_00325 [Candidatus Saccharibacteria bacterium]|nr:hypothetical protein [Candidatus Saccharibacteria bacterium]
MALYEVLGPISIAQLWLCLWFMLRRWPGNKSMSYSAHAAATRKGIIYYFVIFSLHMFLFYLFVANWFAPTFNLPTIFTAILLVAILGQFTALIVPTTGGKKTTLHDLASYLMYVMLVPLCLFITFSSNFSDFARFYATIAAIYMVISWFIFALNKHKDNFYLFQTLYGLSFHTSILVAMYFQ